MGTPRWLVGATALGLAVLSGCASSGRAGSAAGGPATGGRPTPSASSSTTAEGGLDQVHGLALRGIRCGLPFRAPGAPQLVVSGSFPRSVAAGATSLSGRVSVSAGRSGLTGVVAPAAEVFLVRANRVVTLPATQDSVGLSLRLRPGASQSLTAPAPLRACDGSLPDSALPKGAYDVYVRVTVSRDDGTRVESFGGPWPLEVR